MCFSIVPALKCFGLELLIGQVLSSIMLQLTFHCMQIQRLLNLEQGEEKV